VKEVILEVKNLCKYFDVGNGNVLNAVDNISFNIYKGETLGIVGESGCGKTTLGRTILGLYGKTNGNVKFYGSDVHSLSLKEKKYFKKKAQIILQDPYASLNPRMTVKDIIAEGMDAQKIYMGRSNRERKRDEILKLLELVGLNKNFYSRFPHEFSGGQRQRIGIARALAVKPEFIVCDEPISALDVSIQAQIVNLFMKLQEEMNLTYLFIAHDLAMVRHISDRVGVMYLGAMMEMATSDDIYENPMHPYTKSLISAVPSVDINNPIKSRRIILKGEVPSPINIGEGCRFRNRCPYSKKLCFEQAPKFQEIKINHFVACHYPINK
jgi:oligopeptide transport system ATP-binding protein